MKQLLVLGTALLGLAASEPAAHAQRFEFDYTSSLVPFTVPINGIYQIVAFGAQGGDGFYFNVFSSGFSAGGKGAEIGGNFTLTAGEVLQIAVGGAGQPASMIGGKFGGSGGGGSFIVGPGNTPLVIAGGGGGMFAGEPYDGEGSLTTSGNGNGGPGGCCAPGDGGGGFFSAGGTGVAPGDATGGGWPNLAGGIPGGGFGGGGGAARSAGGGGGYSGGAGGGNSPEVAGSGGGGGMSDEGTSEIAVADIWPGNGKVMITIISPVFAGTPGKANCQGQSVSGLAQQFGGIDAAATALGYPTVQGLQDGIMAYCQKPIS